MPADDLAPWLSRPEWPLLVALAIGLLIGLALLAGWALAVCCLLLLAILVGGAVLGLRLL
jgi:hypothetical protein